MFVYVDAFWEAFLFAFIRLPCNLVNVNKIYMLIHCLILDTNMFLSKRSNFYTHLFLVIVKYLYIL